METRNIALTLEKAKEWYNSGNTELKETALQAYKEEELIIPTWENIKTFSDACKVLGIEKYEDIRNIARSTTRFSKHLIAIWKLDIIRKALNGDWNPSLVEGRIYYPYVKFYPAGDKAEEVIRNNNLKICQAFINDGKKYSLVGGYYGYSCDEGLGYFGCGYGSASIYLGLLGCKSREIAEHMSTYFAKEIFEACYAQHNNYEWV